jgi:hypothetical protein
VFEQMMEKMKAGEDGYDPMSIYQPMMEKGMSAMTNFQQNLMSMMMAGQSKD